MWFWVDDGEETKKIVRRHEKKGGGGGGIGHANEWREKGKKNRVGRARSHPSLRSPGKRGRGRWICCWTNRVQGWLGLWEGAGPRMEPGEGRRQEREEG